MPLTTSLEDELPMAPAGWSGNVTPYLWFSGVSGDLENGSTSSDVHESPIGAFGDAELGVLVNAEVHHGVHGGWVEFYGQQIEDEHASSGGASADTEIEQASFEAVYVHTLADHPATDVYAGLRHWAVDTTIDIDGGPSPSRDESWVDPIVGVRRRFVLADTWNLTARGDIGGLNVGDASDFTWNLVAQAEHPVSDRATWVIGYRALGVDYDEGSSFEHDVITHGVLTGVSVRF